MRRPSFRDRALVVRSHDFGEADRVVVLLTREHGLVRGVAKGVRRSKSRFGSRIQPFVDLDVHLYPGRSLATITQADTVHYFGAGIIEDYDTYTAAFAALETAERFSHAAVEGEPFLFDAVVEVLHRFQSTGQPSMILDGFLLQVMAHAGWAPVLFDCAQCGSPGPHHAFHPAVGGAACHQCRPPGSAEVPKEALHLMWLLAGDYLGKAEEMAVHDPELAAFAHRLTRAHLQWHLEQKVTSLAVMDQM